MKLTLPRPYNPQLPLREAILLECLSLLDREGLGIVAADSSTVAGVLQIPVARVEEDLASLNRRRIVLLGANEFAILSRISTFLRQERDRNRMRASRGTPPDWTFHQRVLKAFPVLRGPVSRPASYNRPAVFEPVLKEHEHYHRKECPADVEIFTEAFYPGELTSLLTVIAEQQSAHRTPVLLFTRKALYVGVRRAPKR